MRILLKFIFFPIIFVSFGINCLLFFPALIFFPWKTRKILSFLLMLYARAVLKILGVKTTLYYQETQKMSESPNALCVANHMSYLDVVILAAIRPCCFVTSQEVREDWFLGPITILSGCLFVERRRRTNRAQEVQQLSEALKNGLSVLFFPEATSTDATKILRFRGLLFRGALNTQIPVKPYCLNYTHISGKKFSEQNRDIVCWYDNRPFGGHLLKLLQQVSIHAEVHSLDSVPVTSLTTKEDLIAKSQTSITQFFKPVITHNQQSKNLNQARTTSITNSHKSFST